MSIKKLILIFILTLLPLGCAGNAIPPKDEQLVVKITAVRWECTTTFERNGKAKKLYNYGPKGKEIVCLEPKYGNVTNKEVVYFYKWESSKLEREGKVFVYECDFNSLKKGDQYLGYLCPNILDESQETWCFTEQIK